MSSGSRKRWTFPYISLYFPDFLGIFQNRSSFVGLFARPMGWTEQGLISATVVDSSGPDIGHRRATVRVTWFIFVFGPGVCYTSEPHILTLNWALRMGPKIGVSPITFLILVLRRFRPRIRTPVAEMRLNGLKSFFWPREGKKCHFGMRLRKGYIDFIF